MCGIWCSIVTETGESRVSKSSTCPVCSLTNGQNAQVHIEEDKDPTLLMCTLLKNRGPDISLHRCYFPGGHELQFIGHVLWTRGQFPCPQPVSNGESSHVLLFNGDIYSYEDVEQNDTTQLFLELVHASTELEDPLVVIGKLRGPFAFIFYDRLKNVLWFARDIFGRQSLLFSYSNSRDWHLSSVSTFPNTFEIPAAGVFRLNLSTKQVTLYLYENSSSTMKTLVHSFSDFLKNAGELMLETSTEQHVPFPGLTRLKEPCCESNSSELILQQLTELNKLETNPVLVLKKAYHVLLEVVEPFLTELRRSVRLRVSTKPPFCKDCIGVDEHKKGKCLHSKIAVLFSGGLDSTVLAYLAAETLQPGESLDLINVAFAKSQHDSFDNIPDRVSGLESYRCLQSVFEPQNKHLRFITVNVTKAQVESARQSRIRYLISPLNSVLDDSIGCCLWFAARAAGLDENQEHYVSPARIFLLGSGADELLGGYGRHRTAFEKSSWTGLIHEMQMELDRISLRNLGRDNRIVSDHGISPRMPFLDENVVAFLTQRCDVWVKCFPVPGGPMGTRGLGEKLLLRAVAYHLFGDEFANIALFPKRAMQFGSRIAKLENSKEKGADQCFRLKSTTSGI